MKRLFIFIFGIFLIFSVNAEIQTFGTFRINTDIELKQIGAGFTNCYIISILYPNSTPSLSIETEMIKTGNEYSYSYNKTSELGQYIVNGYCSDGIEDTVWNYDFKITPSGVIPTTAQGSLSIGILGSIILLMFFFGWLSFKFMESEKGFPIGIFFFLISIIASIYGLYLGVIYSRDYLYSSVANVQSKIFIGVMYGLVGIMFLGLLMLILMAVGEIKERKSIQRYGENYDRKAKIYRY